MKGHRTTWITSFGLMVIVSGCHVLPVGHGDMSHKHGDMSHKHGDMSHKHGEA